MRKTVLLTGLAALAALSSCTMDEIKEVNQGTPIGFRTSVATRGLQVEYTSDLETFYSTAWVNDDAINDPYFENLQFSALGDGYTSATTYYWPKGKNLNFYAYAPGVGEMGEGAEVNITKEAQTIKDYQLPQEIDEQDDLIYAVNTGENGAGVEEQASVPLRFAHMLSKIDIYVSSSYDLYEYNFKGVNICGHKTKGTVDLATTTWSDLDVVGKSTKTLETPVVIKSGQTSDRLLGTILDYASYKENNYAFVIPQEFNAWDPDADPANENNGAYISLQVQINTKDGTRVYPIERDYARVAVPIPTGEWKAGYEYEYHLDFTEGAGYVDPDDVPEGGEGGSILGNPIKITMEMTPIQDSELGVVTNEDMIGYWEIDRYHRVETNYTNSDKNVLSSINIEDYVIDETHPNGLYTEKHTYYTLTELTEIPEVDSENYVKVGEKVYVQSGEPSITSKIFATKEAYVDDIDGRVANFGRVTITDGTKLEVVFNSQTIKTDFYIEKDNIDDDELIEYIMFIDAFKSNGKYLLYPIIETLTPVDGDTPGEANLTGGESFTYYDYVNELHYTITPIEK